MPQRIDKPWGYEIIWAYTPFYVGKILHINAGAKLSRQFHIKKTETFMIKSGEMNLETSQNDEQIIIHMKPGDVFHCPPHTLHRMCAITETEVIEVSTPELDDVVRIEDDYGRINYKIDAP